jgi:hypothetical protein
MRWLRGQSLTWSVRDGEEKLKLECDVNEMVST